MRIALAGNPNSGKTTLFNQLTGSNQFVGNWPGVTVERKSGFAKKQKDVEIIDLPGIYSLSPYTLEEEVTRDYLIDESPDAIINIIDGSNLERNLYLSLQLLELGIPMVIAVNMMDLVTKEGDYLDLPSMGEVMGTRFVGISAMKGDNLDTLLEAAMAATERPQPQAYPKDVEAVLRGMSASLEQIPEAQRRWFAVKLFERDVKVHDKLGLSEAEVRAMTQIIAPVETARDDDSESIITSERYATIARLLEGRHAKANPTRLTLSDRIDRVVTNRWLALPIFVVVIFMVYFLAVHPEGIGTKGTDWVNEGVFGDGWFLAGQGREAYDEAVEGYEEASVVVDAYEAAEGQEAVAVFYDDEGQVVEERQVTEAMYQEAASVDEPEPSAFGHWVPGIPVLAARGMDAINVHEDLQDLVIDGVIAGVGGVLGFLPMLMVLFVLLAILEAIGYMARIAFILDRAFRRFGLSGKSFIPMLIGTGCSIPGIMAARTIENDRDRRITVTTTSFMPCGAKLPVIALIAGAFFRGQAWVAPMAYFVGIAAVIVSGIILKKTKRFAGAPSPFVIELPAYHLPRLRDIARSVWDRSVEFVQRAGTIILVSSMVIWGLSNYGFSGGFGRVDVEQSLLAGVGNAFAWVFAPLGWGSWKPAVATITGLIAKENIVGTFGVFYGNREVAENGWQIWQAMAVDFNGVAAFSFLVFNLLCAPCFAAIGAIRREMQSASWTAFAIAYQTGLAYAAALMVYQFGMAIQGQRHELGFVVALLILAVGLYFLFRPNRYKDGLAAARLKGASV